MVCRSTPYGNYGNDDLTDTDGQDGLYGEAGNDVFHTKDSDNADVINGG